MVSTLQSIDSDAAAVADAVSDPSAFASLYLRYVDSIYRYCVRRLGSKEAAEDATSLIFTKALSAISTQRSDGPPFRAWIFTIAQHTIADEWRRSNPTTVVVDELDLIDPAASPEAAFIDDEAGRAVRELLAQLPRDQADIVALRLAGLRGPEIARVMDRSPNTVKVTQHRAYVRLRALLGGKEAVDAN